jgi:hypothetical protein
MSTQTTQSRKHVQDPSQRSQATADSASATTAGQCAAAPVDGPLLFCPRCGMANSFESEPVCRNCRYRYCPTCSE